MQSAPQREFSFHDRDFQQITRLVREKTGIVLGERKRDLVYGRLARRIRALGLSDFTDYCAHLESSEGQSECRMMVNAITTNLTGFFREPHHFEFLAKQIAADAKASRPGSTRRLRIWSAGCSSGEEPYSIAMTLRSVMGGGAWDAKVLATDIDTDMVATAKAGRYPAGSTASIPVNMQRYLGRQAAGEHVVMPDGLRSMIVFKPLNLFDEWPMRGPFDAVFCRNVMIYFDMEAKRTLFDRFADILKPSGWLFIGHSESLFRLTPRFRHAGRTIYERVS
jgi:chemotaxis protein methyltransferase CheR